METMVLISAAAATLIVLIARKRLVIALVFACAILLCAAFAPASCVRARPISARNACVSNLELIQSAKAEWVAQNHKVAPDSPRINDLFSSNNPAPYHRIPECPGRGEYKPGATNQNPTCSLAADGHVLR